MPLGKSLDNILGDYFGQTEINLNQKSEPQSTESPKGVAQILIERIELSPYQTRTNFEQSKIESLAKDILEQGLISPVVVLQKKFTQTTEPEYILLAGERRLRAVKFLGQKSILAIVKLQDQLSEKQQALISAMENLQREDLSPVELGQTYKMLMLTQNLDESGLAQMLGTSAQYIKNYLRLLELCGGVKDALNKKLIGEGQARYLVGLSEERQLEVLALILEKEMTVKEVIEYLKHEKQNTPKPQIKSLFHNLPTEIIAKADKFASQFNNSKLKCVGDLNKGKIVISWDNTTKSKVEN
jgi:ParB family chromosome partitioning protein